MFKKSNLLLSAGVLALAALPLSQANAAAPMGFVGTVGAAYGSTSVDDVDGDADTWILGGSGAFGFGPQFGAQVDVSYNSVSVDDEDADGFGLGGSVFWAPAMGRAGVSLQWGSASEGPVDVDTLVYGIFGEYYAGDFFTLAGKAGLFNVEVDVEGFDSDSEDGYYLGGAVTGYAMPNLAIQGDILFASADDLDLDGTTFGIGAEFLVSEMVPIAIFGGYSWSNVEVGGFDVDSDTWMIGARFYFGAAGPTLVDKHRNGTLGWAGATNVNSFIAP
jgi:hypothetical protein